MLDTKVVLEEKKKLNPRKRFMQLIVQVKRLKNRHGQSFGLKHVKKSVQLHHRYPKSYIKLILIYRGI